MNNILIVDDKENILKLLEMSIKDEVEDVIITTCSDPIQASNLISMAHFDLIITDYNMPKMNGLELVKSIRMKSMSIPIIMVSGDLKIDPASVDDLMLHGINGFIKKSSKIEDFVKKVKQFL